MEIKNFIKIYDNAINIDCVSSLIKYVNVINFKQAAIISDDNKNSNVNFDVRRTFDFPLSNNPENNSSTTVHWNNYLLNTFSNKIFQYKQDLNILDLHLKGVNDISILKYENSGFYTYHVDHCVEFPRSLSCILLLNNDYRGGNLCFRNPDGSNEWEVEVKVGRMIIWPSNFLYPHTVKPVIEGTRYSVVAWAV
jgi:hypothetical protein